MWKEIITDADNPQSDGEYPIWVKGISEREWKDYGTYIQGTWYLDGGDTNIGSTKYKIIAWYQVPAYR